MSQDLQVGSVAKSIRRQRFRRRFGSHGVAARSSVGRKPVFRTNEQLPQPNAARHRRVDLPRRIPDLPQHAQKGQRMAHGWLSQKQQRLQG